MDKVYKEIVPETLDWSKALWAQKTATIQAVFVAAGTHQVTTMADGRIEAESDAAQDGGYKITNPDGEEYIIEPETLFHRYEATPDANIFRPKYNPVEILQVKEAVSFIGKPRNIHYEIEEGGFLVRMDTGEIYGIEPDLFAHTYKILPQITKAPLEAYQL